MKQMPRSPPAIMLTLRLWQEVIDAQHSEWRGEIKNVMTGEARYFRRWEELAEIVLSMLAGSGKPSGSKEGDD